MSAARSDVRGNAAAGVRRNNFDLLRLAAAAQVMLVHLGDNLFHHGNAVVHLLRYFPGVPVFFLISGFLISASWERNSDWRVYARNRFLRIMPGYWAVFLFSLAAIVFGSGIDLVAHLRDLLLWIAAQLVFLPGWNPAFLRGYGTGVVNGSLWTIPVELSFYLAIPPLYWLFARTGRANRILVAAIVLSFGFEYLILGLAPHLPAMVIKGLALSPFPAFGMFACGVLAQRNWERLHLLVAGRLWLFAGIYLAVGVPTLLMPGNPIFFGMSHIIGIFNFAALALLVLSAAYTAPDLALRLLHRNDISYGLYLYLYHLPIANVLLAHGLSGSRAYTLAVTGALAAATLSWFAFEKPMLHARRWAFYRRAAMDA